MSRVQSREAIRSAQTLGQKRDRSPAPRETLSRWGDEPNAPPRVPGRRKRPAGSQENRRHVHRGGGLTLAETQWVERKKTFSSYGRVICRSCKSRKETHEKDKTQNKKKKKKNHKNGPLQDFVKHARRRARVRGRLVVRHLGRGFFRE